LEVASTEDVCCHHLYRFQFLIKEQLFAAPCKVPDEGTDNSELYEYTKFNSDGDNAHNR